MTGRTPEGWHVEVRREAGYWSVYVNGSRMVDRESFWGAARIAESLIEPGRHYPSESDEVANSIRRWMFDAPRLP